MFSSHSLLSSQREILGKTLIINGGEIGFQSGLNIIYEVERSPLGSYQNEFREIDGNTYSQTAGRLVCFRGRRKINQTNSRSTIKAVPKDPPASLGYALI
jgi:hypothetical protein